MTNDDIILAVLAEEGRFANNPADPGGATNWGITQGTLAWARGRPVSVAEVAALGQEEAKAIYLKLFVLGPGFDRVADARLRWQLVDYGVNSGPSIAIGRIQGILKVAEDGVLGPQTLKAINDHPDPTALGNALAKARVTMLVGIAVKKHSPFWGGWLRRALKFIAPLLLVTLPVVGLTGASLQPPPSRYDLPTDPDAELCVISPRREQVCVAASLLYHVILQVKKA